MMLARRALLALPFLPVAARAQEAPYPDRPVTIVNPWPAGGSSDSVTRILAQRLGVELGQPVVVENRPGATGTLGHAYVARARPDGYTLLLGTNSTYGIAPHLVPNIPYDSERAFTGISLVAKSPQLLCVHPSLPARSLEELLALARTQPDKLSFATSGIGGTSHMATEMLLAMGGISMLHVPYRGGGPAAQALLAGEVQVTFIDAITALPFIAAGQIRPLGVSTRQRTPLAPEVPTLAESGLPEFESSTDFAFMAVAGTPDAVVRRLYAATRASLANAEVRGKLESAGLLVLGEPPEAFEAYAKAESAKWGRVIRERNIRAP
ncbi:tripartite tricarboxylate transporter substrate binding protein [Siccirubricoccus sp. KC 17139]|uniref:Tripartite tricarboxylate transporter substrate binding protein n=1 Tax=Siccirubricoccus soli TaxID=2899147 RepID=A0ABT1D411_9PROT|nr:tripartite tricarboxylate transporter substrate binding protein [Siccirubricoccus soli]MCO6416357.1 tripartite tricarboxylate transporter substrate binding protein [Siccirubricoccus soli]MCP2682491.1 tripartite tricarboxylate transporter substrate binding protein [Siccirubricoccus soli]